MAVQPPIVVASVNMRKRNAVTHALLNSDLGTNLFLIQEPWFDTIGTARKDTARQGVDVLGGVASPGWEVIYPNIPEGRRPKVMAYARRRTANPQFDRPFSTVPRLDLSTHQCLQVLDVILDEEVWRIINFYNDVRDSSSLQALTSLDIDATIPTLVVGDFNTHSPRWSPPGIPKSSWTDRLEEWAATNLLTLANNPGEITRRGADHERDSVIDLVWYNEAAVQSSTFTNLSVDWSGSLGSDHALLRITGQTRAAVRQPAQEPDLGLLTDPERKDQWIQAFKARSLPLLLPSSPTIEGIERAAAGLIADIQHTNEQLFRRRKPFHPKAAPWWNPACAVAAQTLRNARNTQEKGIAQRRLKGTVRVAKREWANGVIEKTNLWDVAAWRHGRRVSKVPSLRGPEGLVHSHDDIADILKQRFFAATPPQVATQFHDDPPRQPPRRLPQIDKDLIGPLLEKANAKSAPGQSGHTWTIIKWAWEADAERIVELLAACLKAGHHPRQWKEAIVSVIPKAGRADYTMAKNFRPISLLECLGKLLEKVAAKLLYRDMAKLPLVPTTQFGGRNASSTLDAGLTLVHDIQSAHQAGLYTGLLLFDIKGFFDNVNHERLVQLLGDLGYAPELVNWCRSFLKDRTVRLRFNGRTAEPFNFVVGTPQGSPVSPVLSTIYTSPLLHKMRDWTNSSLGMYIDDGAIFACGRSWKAVEKALRENYATCIEWITRAGLDVEPDKTELIFFRNRTKKTAPPPYTHLPLPAQQTYYRVQASQSLRYLGFFFDTNLNWSHHVEVMCNRTRATIKALQLLGNSVRGLDHARWRLAYNAICLPVLTYGCQLWYTGKQKGLVQRLQIVQNEAVKVISGAFRTAPREPLHQLLSILPMDLRLTMLTQNTALRLYKVSKESQLLRRLGGDWHTPQPHDLPLPTPNSEGSRTVLRSLAARVPSKGPRTDQFPETPPGAPDWDGRVTRIPKQKDWDYPRAAEVFSNLCKEGRTINIYSEGTVSNRHREDDKQVGAASAVLYHQGREWKHTERVLGETVTENDTAICSLTPVLDVLADFLDSQQEVPQRNILIFLASNFAVNRALDASPHEEQAVSIEHLRRLGELLETHPDVNIRLLWLPRNNRSVGFKRAKQLALEAIRTADLTNFEEPHSIKKQKEATRNAATATWAERWHQTPHASLVYKTALTRPPDGRTHPTFLTGEQAAKFSRLTLCTMYRIITGHAFVGSYTQRFFPQHTPDQVACPCGTPVQTIEHILLVCPIYATARRKHLTANGRPRNLSQLFNHPKRVVTVLRFLEETGVCAKPRTEWEPG